VIRYETKELFHYQPAVYEILEQKREVMACPAGCEGIIMTAPNPLHVLPKAKVTEALLAHIIVSKVDDRQPLYHVEKQLLQRYGLELSRQTLARWLIETTQALQPLYNLMKDELIGYDIAACDATMLQVLQEPDRSATRKSYVYCMRGGPPYKSAILYNYNAHAHKRYLIDWFAGFQGVSIQMRIRSLTGWLHKPVFN